MTRKSKTSEQSWEEYQKYVEEYAIKEYGLPWKVAKDFADILINGKLIKHGNFIQAVLLNNLMETSYFADECNWNNLSKICRWVYSEIPCDMWGENARNWQGFRNMEESK